jgi:serine O-acetyltransferase
MKTVLSHEAAEMLATKLADSAGPCSSLRNIGKVPFPSHAELRSVIQDLDAILLPGVHQSPPADIKDCKAMVSRTLASLAGRLTGLITTCLNRRMLDGQTQTASNQNDRNNAEEAAVITMRVLERLPEIAVMLSEDAEAAWLQDPAAPALDEVIWCYPGLHAVLVHRVAHELWREGVPLLPRAMAEIAHASTGIDIHPGARIGRRFFIDHGTGVVIGETTEIGDRVTLYQGVTLGAISFAKDSAGALIKGQKRHPTIEDEVTIYANATILGGETRVGRGSVIGSGVWLHKSVAPWSIVTLDRPMLRIRKPGDTPWGNESGSN